MEARAPILITHSLAMYVIVFFRGMASTVIKVEIFPRHKQFGRKMFTHKETILNEYQSTFSQKKILKPQKRLTLTLQ